MKFSFYILILLLVSCKKDDDKIAYSEELDKSFNSWQDFKTSSSNSYRFNALFSSFGGYNLQTIITVKDGAVIARDFTKYAVKFDPNSPRPDTTVLTHWSEGKDSINIHTEGYIAVPLDVVYKKARELWLVKKDGVKNYFDVLPNGLISYCGYVPDNCMDDCFEGIHIGFVEKL